MLKAACAALYQQLLTRALGPLISADWVIGEARELGVAVSAAQVRHRFEEASDGAFPTEAKFQKFLGQSGENIPDLLFNLEQDMLDTRIGEKLHGPRRGSRRRWSGNTMSRTRRRMRSGNSARVELVRTRSAATARQLKRELASGVSFATVATRLAGEQPVYTAGTKGLITGLEPHVFAEQAMNTAIFSARPHVAGRADTS